jgi:acyl carrier protein
MPDEKHIRSEVLKLLRDIKGSPLSAATGSTRLIEDLGFDSLQMMILITRLPWKFHFTLDDDEFSFENFITVDAVVTVVVRKKLAAGK